MRRMDGVYWITFYLVFILVVGSVAPIADYADTGIRSTVTVSEPERLGMTVAYELHTPIVIDGDANFTATAGANGWPGDGSDENPFIIENNGINPEGVSGHCINISNTRVNFTIRNCNLTGASADAGIYLNNVSYGFLSNNTCILNRYGIYLVDSNHNTIANNTCTENSDRGLYMYNSDFNTVTDNDFDDNANYGIILYYCDSSLFSRNLCSINRYTGIHARYAVSNTFENNICNRNGDDGIRIWYYSSGNILSNNTCNDNGDYGILIDNDYHLWLSAIVADNTCSGNDAGIYASGSFFNVVNNVLTDNEWRGISIEGCYESTFTHNYIEGSYEGIWFSHCSYSTLSQNSITGSDWGIWFEESNENMISQNSITMMVQFGIVLSMDSSVNTLYLNEISVDLDAFYDEFTGIVLDSSTSENNVTMNYILHEGPSPEYFVAMRDDCTYSRGNIIDRNWYEDYSGHDIGGGIGDDPYDIYGAAGNSDLHPLIYPPFAPTWVEPPTDQVIDYWNQPFIYNLNATAPTAITWTLNNTVQFTVNSNGIVQSITDLPVGVYGLRIKVTNLYGIYITGSFQLTMQEISQPEWIVGPMDINLNYGDELDYGFIAADDSGIADWAINDTTNFELSATHLNVTGYVNGWQLLQITNTTTLVAGVYPLNVTITDPYGNSLSGLFTITILSQEQDLEPPVWVIAPADQILEFNTSFQYFLSANDLSGIESWIINNTLHFTIFAIYYQGGSTVVITNSTNLIPGIYPLNITVFDFNGNELSAIFTVTVEPQTQDTTSPIWIVAPINEVIDDVDSFEQRLGAWDSSGIDRWWLNDTAHFTLDGQGLIRNATVLESGVYRLEVRAYDPFDNFCTATFTVTVLKAFTTTSTTTTTSTSDSSSTTTNTTLDGQDFMVTLVLGAGLGSAAIIILTIVVFLKKKT
ncbi:MAG: hypothetical protein E4H14_09160 [Candidatus Thorarchaeota archaeon]|nr:MAG: hypothetical protein E4H14_09160 [Candidatus Thorarchaeota archaeon]